MFYSLALFEIIFAEKYPCFLKVACILARFSARILRDQLQILSEPIAHAAASEQKSELFEAKIIGNCELVYVSIFLIFLKRIYRFLIFKGQERCGKAWSIFDCFFKQRLHRKVTLSWK